MGFKCQTCKRVIGKKPYMRFTTNKNDNYAFCINCIRMGLANLRKIEMPTKEELDLMTQFNNFLRMQERKKRIEA